MYAKPNWTANKKTTSPTTALNAFISLKSLDFRLGLLNRNVGDQDTKENVRAFAFYPSVKDPTKMVPANILDQHERPPLDREAEMVGFVENKPLVTVTVGQARLFGTNANEIFTAALKWTSRNDLEMLKDYLNTPRADS